MKNGHVLVAASTEAGRNFIRLLLYRQVPVAALTNNKREERLLQGIGVKEIMRVDTLFNKTEIRPAFPVDRVFIFEVSLPLTCAYLQVVSRWCCRSVTVVTTMWHPQVIYKKLGASIVLRTQTGEVGFLLDPQFNDSGGMP